MGNLIKSGTIFSVNILRISCTTTLAVHFAITNKFAVTLNEP